MRTIRVLGLSVLLQLGAFGNAAHADPAPRAFSIAPGSEVAYHVKAKLLGVFDEDITGTNREVSGHFSLPATGQPSGWIEALVLGFKSGIRSRDAHVAGMLGNPHLPRVRFDLTGLEGLDAARADGSVVAVGILTANGRTQELRFPLVYHLSEGQLVLSGEAHARFTDFGIAPPVLGFVLKRAPNALDLRVRLRAQAYPSDPPARVERP